MNSKAKCSMALSGSIIWFNVLGSGCGEGDSGESADGAMEEGGTDTGDPEGSSSSDSGSGSSTDTGTGTGDGGGSDTGTGTGTGTDTGTGSGTDTGVSTEDDAYPADLIVAPQGQYACAVIEGEVNCWGCSPPLLWSQASEDGPVDEIEHLGSGDGIYLRGGEVFGGPHENPEGEALSDMSAALNICALRTDRTPRCWGSWETPQLDAPDEPLIAISTARTTTYGVTVEGRMVSWGEFDAPGGEDWSFPCQQQEDAACGVSLEGNLSCWAGPPHALDLEIPDVSDCAVLDGRVCVAASGKVICFDENGPEDAGVSGIFRIEVAPSGGCGISVDGEIVCWGDDSCGLVSASP